MQRILAMSLVGLLSTSAFAASDTGWSGIGGNVGHTGYLNTTSDAAKFTILWSKKITDPATTKINPGMLDMSVSNESAYVSISRLQKANDYPYQGMFALNAKTGELRWHNRIPAEIDLVSAPAIDGGWLYYNMNESHASTGGRFRGYVGAYGPAGTPVFSKRVLFNSGAASLSSPMVVFGSLFTKDYSKIYEFDSMSGNPIKAYDVPHNDAQVVITSNFYFISTLYSDFNLFDFMRGKSAYTVTTPGQSADSAYANVIFDKQSSTAFDVFYHTETDNSAMLYALDVNKQEIKWSYPLNKMAHQAAFADGTVYVVSDQTLQAIDASTGKLKWHWAIDRFINGESYQSFAPVITNNHIFISGCGYTFAINRVTHQKDWEFNQSGKLLLNDSELFILNDYHNPGTVTAISIN